MAEPGELEKEPDGVSGSISSVAPKPVIMDYEWGGWSQLLIDDRHLSIGWQDRPEKKGGPSYLVGRVSFSGGTKVIERLAFTAEGWAKAWRFLMRNDNALA